MQLEKKVGKAISRLEGAEKVTGKAKFAGEYNVPDLLYGYIVNSGIARGEITDIDESAARALPGVEEIFTHNNRPSLAWFDIMYADMDAPPGSVFKPLHDKKIKYFGQPIALVVADTFEMARYAASLLKVKYKAENFETDLAKNLDSGRAPKKGLASIMKPGPPKAKGDFKHAWDTASAKVALEFLHSTEMHNPMELFASTTVYDGKGKITVYDKTQGTSNNQIYIANVFGLHYKDVRVVSPFVGGAFGSGLRPQYQLFLSVLASLELKRNVRVTMDRSQMFTFGHRPPTLQKTKYASGPDGKLTAMAHAAWGETSMYEDYFEGVVNVGNMLYPAKNTLPEYKLIPLDRPTPLDMRGPGGTTAMHAVESTMDALSYEMKVDPLQFRLLNYAEKDDSSGKPFSSKELKECYRQGAEKFGWEKRNPTPRSMREGNRLIGYGMSSGMWDVMNLPARAEAQITSGGKLIVKSAITDIGTGTLTVMTQIAADEFGLEMGEVIFQYGDSAFPLSPIQGGSYTVGVIGSAVIKACTALKKKILKKANSVEDAFKGKKINDVRFEKGKIFLVSNDKASIELVKIIDANDGKPIKATVTSKPGSKDQKDYTMAAHSAAFVEVQVDEQLGVINVTRALTAVAAGKIVNPKTARSQILGGMVWGISKALREETLSDHNLGKYMNTNLGEYHIPVHADVHDLEVIFVEEKDEIVNALGTKGLGEIGLTAIVPAITNAIYHATGKRINNLPIHFDQLT